MTVKVKYLGPVVDKLREQTGMHVLLNNKKTAIHVRANGEGEAKSVTLKNGSTFKARTRSAYATINVLKNKAGEFVLAATGRNEALDRSKSLIAGLV